MKSTKKVYLISIFMFSLSVIQNMYNMTTEGDASRLIGLPLSFFMLPLLFLNMYYIFSLSNIACSNNLKKLVGMWATIVPLVTLLNGGSFQDLIRVLLWATTFFACYKITINDTDFFKKIVRLFVLILIIGAYYFAKGRLSMFAYDRLNLGSNAVFCVLSALPFALCVKNKYVKIIAIIITFVAVVFSNKRTAFIIMFVALLPALNASLSSIKSRFKKYFIIIGGTIGAIFAFLYLSERYLGNIIFDRFAAIEEDGGSGRDEIWALILNALLKTDVISLLIGHGHYAVSKLGHATAAHNDFLDVIYDYGIVVFIIYLCIHASILKRCYFFYKSRNTLFSPYFFMTIIFIVMSWTSILVVQQRYLIFMAIFWGTIEAMVEKQECN